MATPLHIHLLGIGGAGMAALAKILKELGMTVSGSDREIGTTAGRLMAMGIPVCSDNDDTLLRTADLCGYSAAINANHPLLQYASDHMPTFSRGQLTGQISRRAKTVVAVAGTHGKTTVSAWITYILLLDQKNPSALLGGHLSTIGGNGRLGHDQYMVCEACEFAGNFLHIKRDIGVILNIDNDHLECYGNRDGLNHAFTAFADGCQTMIVCGDDPSAMRASEAHPHRICYGIENPHDVWASDLSCQGGRYTFCLHMPHRTFSQLTLPLAGRHHVQNALAVATVCYQLGVSDAAINKGLTTFPGVDRRFQVITTTPTLTIADDYAHHPAEIAATLQAAREMGFSRITAIFQPFTYSRTAALHHEFADALSSADRVILSPIMGGREPAVPGITSALIGQHLPQVIMTDSLEDCAAIALTDVQDGELLITMGCGNVYQCANQMKDMLEKAPSQA